PRDGGERIPVVVIGRHGLVVVEPRDDEGDLVCYQDYWYRQSGGGAQPLADAPSLRAMVNAKRLRRDLGTGGFINVPIEPLVLLPRGRAADVRSSCVPVIAGTDALARHIADGGVTEPAHARIRALAEALAHAINLATV